MATALTTVTLVQQHLEISTGDAIIAVIVAAVNEGLEGLFGTTFGNTTYTNEEYDMTEDSRFLELKHRPVTSFTRLQYKDNVGDFDDSSWTDFDTGEYVVDLGSGIITKNSQFGKGKRTLRATYAAGYVTVPSDLQLAATIIAGSMYQNRKNTNVQQETLGQYSRTFALDPTSWKKLGIDWIMNKYFGQNVNWFDAAYSEKTTSHNRPFNS